MRISKKAIRRSVLGVAIYVAAYFSLWGTRELGMFATGQYDCVRVAVCKVPALRSRTMDDIPSLKFALELIFFPIIAPLAYFAEWEPTGIRPRSSPKNA